ncbi:MAG: SH3 domain-containing protein, partial [Lachnospiraceae bacterium]|nr:SH3 domain-containing protein [Lachnospiraceae bacterium]
MNQNSKAVRFAGLSIAAGMLVGSSALNASAAPLAGVTGYTSSDATTVADNTLSTRSGVSQMLSSIVVTSEATAKSDAEAAAAAEAEAAKQAAEAAATEAAQYANVGIARVTDYVYIRSAADENSDYVGKLYANAAATVNGEEGDWYQITSGDVTGYINKQYLVVGDRDLINQCSRRYATVTTETLFVRSEPTTDSQVIGMVPMTDDLTVTDESIKDSGWVKVRVTEGEGYVSTEFVTLSTEYTLAESREAEEARL